MGGTRTWLWMGAVGAVAVAGGAMFASSSARPDATALMSVTLPDTAGQQQSLAQWRGNVVIVNFWATWCEPCREEMPDFVRAQREFGARGLQFVGIAVDQPQKVEQFARELELNYPSLIGGYGAVELSKTLGNPLRALPFTVVIDRNGTVAETQLGPFKAGKLRSTIDKLL